MNIIKKLLSFCLAVITVLVFTVSCKNSKQLNVYAVDGAPVIAVSNLCEIGEINGYTVNVNIVNNVDALKGAIARKEADVAVCPINVASTLYNGGVKFQLLSVNVFGVLHLVSKNQSVTFETLKGKTVYNIGEGGTPDVTFKYLLQQNNVEYTINLQTPKDGKVNLKYVPSASDLMPLLKTGVAEYGILGEPAVSQAVNVAGVSSVMNLTSEWYKTNNTLYTQAGVLVNSDLLQTNPKLVKGLFNELKNANNYATENASRLKDVIALKGSTLSINFTSKIISSCNINCLSAYEIKNDIVSYLTVIKNFNKNAVGGKLPDDNFYINYENL